MKIVFIAGGSGGHIIPALAVADQLRHSAPEVEIIFVTSANVLDAEIIRKHSFRYPFQSIIAPKLRRYWSWQNIRDIFLLPVSLWQAYRFLRQENPDVLFSKGGYVALPFGFLARLFAIPLIIHESDLVSGLANRLLKKRATHVLSTFPQAGTQWVGTPIRQEITTGNAEKGRKFLDFSNNRSILLVTGGSQGAEQINQLLLHALPEITKEIDVVHLCGAGKTRAQNSKHYKAFDYIGKEFADVIAAADMVVSRSGANTLFELAAAAKPAILIPLISAANNHQQANADFFAAKKAAVVLDSETLTSATFQKAVLDLFSAPQKQREYAKNMHELYQPDAAKTIAEILMKSAKK